MPTYMLISIHVGLTLPGELLHLNDKRCIMQMNSTYFTLVFPYDHCLTSRTIHSATEVTFEQTVRVFPPMFPGSKSSDFEAHVRCTLSIHGLTLRGLDDLQMYSVDAYATGHLNFQLTLFKDSHFRVPQPFGSPFVVKKAFLVFSHIAFE
ncbi:uncharacterized protein LOC142336992 isoform X2 [Convolutriloba macropyga]|uniref:uncharacterized protein LOC142336992 isoform X2 n=1 Tax=Convolutriloba macropyga TaxID=536237 RepID=UPI003F5290A5